MAKDAKGKGKGKGKEPAGSPMDAWVTRARGIGAVVGFLLSYWVCRRQGFPTTDAILRGLGGAIALSLFAWWSALLVIQALMRTAAAQTREEARHAATQAAIAAEEADAQFGRRPSEMADAS